MADVNPPQAVPQLGPQPNLVLLTQGFQQANTGFQQVTAGLQQAANQLGNFANLPPIAQGNAIVQQLQQLQQQMQHQTQQQQQFQQQMQQYQQQTNLNFADLRNDIQNLRSDLRISRQASEHNSIARIENSGVKKSTAALTVFRDYTTNADIPGFPTTPTDLENMRAVTIDPILRSLDLSVVGDISDRRRRLGHYIGLTNLT